MSKSVVGLLLAVGSLLYFTADLPSLNKAPEGDEIDYWSLSYNLYYHHSFTVNGKPTALRTPGYPLFLCMAHLYPKNPIGLGRLLSVFLTVLTGLLLYGSLYRYTGQVAIAASMAGLWLFFSYAPLMSKSLLAETLAALLVLASLLIIDLGRSTSFPRIALAGLLSGFYIWVRGYLLFVPLGIGLWWMRQARWKEAVLYLIVSYSLVAAWMMRNKVVVGSFTFSTQAAQEILSGNHPLARGSWLPPSVYMKFVRAQHPEIDSLPEVQAARLLFQIGLQNIAEHPLHVLWLLPRKALIYLLPHSTYMGWNFAYLLVAPLAAYAIYALLLREGFSRQSVAWLFLYLFLLALMPILITFGDPRFRYPIEPLFFLLGGLGIAHYRLRLHSPPPKVS